MLNRHQLLAQVVALRREVLAALGRQTHRRLPRRWVVPQARGIASRAVRHGSPSSMRARPLSQLKILNERPQLVQNCREDLQLANCPNAIT
jgi:hypothetical protein